MGEGSRGDEKGDCMKGRRKAEECDLMMRALSFEVSEKKTNDRDPLLTIPN